MGMAYAPHPVAAWARWVNRESGTGHEVQRRRSVQRRSIASMTAADPMGSEQLALSQARRMLRFVAVSRQAFPSMRDLADHPGWEIMLHVFIAGRECRTITAGELCDVTGCWRPLAVRYIELMIERALMERDFVPGNPEFAPLRLTVEAERRLMVMLSDFALSGFEAGPETGQA